MAIFKFSSAGPDSFYVTNDRYFHFDQVFLRLMEVLCFTRLLKSGVVYFDGKKSYHVAGGMVMTNGIAQSRDGRYSVFAIIINSVSFHLFIFIIWFIINLYSFPGGSLPIMDYTGMLRGTFLGSRYGKGVLFSGWRYVKGAPLQGKVCERVPVFQNLVLGERVPIFQNLVCVRVRAGWGSDLGRSILYEISRPPSGIHSFFHSCSFIDLLIFHSFSCGHLFMNHLLFHLLIQC